MITLCEPSDDDSLHEDSRRNITLREEDPLCQNLTVLLLSRDEREACDIRRLLAPHPLSQTLTWHHGPLDSHQLPTTPGARLCVLVGSAPSGQNALDIAARVRHRAPQAAVVLLSDAPAHDARPDDFPTRVDHRRTTPDEFRREIRRALRRAHRDIALATVRANAVIAQDHVRLERGLLPDLALDDKDFTSASHYAPSRPHALLGGDFCDIVQSEDRTVHVVMGDVSGHGATEAALAVHLRLAWRTAALCGQSAMERLRLLERVLVDERPHEDTYATVVSLSFPPHRRSVRVISAGHPGMLHRHAGGIRWVEHRPGLALGLFPGRGDWTESEHALADQDSVVLFTDGLYEGRTSRGRLGEEGLMRLAARHAHLPDRHFVDALVRGVSASATREGGAADDVAVLHLGWNGSRTEPAL
ncbi:PP2C family protein-serine/threonine phosphatase [Streptomyces fructofermentans]|uniref:PP2C family protein-serine/threonine phosphatase n=1 Tax=Streptomyces fructofermentans TaxID=152141 RepID=UPI0033DED534